MAAVPPQKLLKSATEQQKAMEVQGQAKIQGQEGREAERAARLISWHS